MKTREAVKILNDQEYEGVHWKLQGLMVLGLSQNNNVVYSFTPSVAIAVAEKLLRDTGQPIKEAKPGDIFCQVTVPAENGFAIYPFVLDVNETKGPKLMGGYVRACNKGKDEGLVTINVDTNGLWSAGFARKLATALIKAADIAEGAKP